VEVNSGFGWSTQWLTESFFHAFTNNHPFQIIWNERRWLYSPPPPPPPPAALAAEALAETTEAEAAVASNNTNNKETTNNNNNNNNNNTNSNNNKTNNKNISWAYCDTEDTRCYYLPISNCDRSPNRTRRNEHYERKPQTPVEHLQFHWLRKFLFRPNQQFRYQIMKQKSTIDFRTPCTVLHVRRSDAGLPRPPYRRYAAIREYLDKLPTTTTKTTTTARNVLLLTDDESTITELYKHFLHRRSQSNNDDTSSKFKSNYSSTTATTTTTTTTTTTDSRYHNIHWMFLDRPRNRNIQNGFDGHIPTNSDPAAELVAIYVELELAKQCQEIVYGESGFVKSLLQEIEFDNFLMPNNNRNGTTKKKGVERYYLDTRVSAAEAQVYRGRKEERVRDFLNEIELLYQKDYHSSNNNNNNNDGNTNQNNTNSIKHHSNHAKLSTGNGTGDHH